MFKEKLTNRSGIALVELMIGIGLITMTFLAISKLLDSSIRTNQVNINSFVAYNLAEEGIELLRNVRDSNWTMNVAWNGDVNSVFSSAGKFNDNLMAGAYYLVYLDPENLNMIELEKKPEFKFFSTDEFFAKVKDKAKLYKYNRAGSTVYSNKNLSEKQSTRYSRYLFIQDTGSKDGIVNKVKVISTVIWREKWNSENSPQKVELVTELTDWKEGAI